MDKKAQHNVIQGILGVDLFNFKPKKDGTASKVMAKHAYNAKDIELPTVQTNTHQKINLKSLLSTV